MPPVKYIAQPLLEIDGKPASNELLEDILQISVEESLHLPGMFTLIIKNDYFPGRKEDKTWRHEELFAIGKAIKIGFSSSTTQSQEFNEEQKGYLLEGEITAMETHFTSQSEAPMVIRGYDVSHRLHRGRYNRSFQDMTDSDIIKKILGEVGISAGTIDSSGDPHSYVFQENQTNMEFFRERAARNGFELFVQDNKLNFRKPKVDESLELKWLEDMHSFSVRVTSAQQVSGVEVRGWDYEKKQAIVETASKENVLTDTQKGKGSQTSSSFKGKPPSPTMIVVDQPVFKAKEAKTMAQSLCDELGGEFVHADAKADGNPKIRPGRAITLKDLGKYSGKYYVTETRHLYQERIYITEFSVRGLREGDLLGTLSPQTHLQPGQTLLVGLVTDNNDPKGWGRVKVKFPTLTDKHDSNWARVLGTGAGTGRGFDCLPEIDDEVLVAFEHGDIHRPYVIAGVWNGNDKPPEKVEDSVVDRKVRLRTFKTRTGHKLQFVEEDKGSSKKGFYVDTVYQHKLHLNDSDKFIEIKTKDGYYVRLDDKDQFIELKTKNGHSVRLDDRNRKIEIKSNGGHTYVMDDMSRSVKIKSVGSMSIEATTTMDIKASGIVTVKGALIKLN
ncbi:MAG: VgrG-related protein [Phormidium sp.]